MKSVQGAGRVCLVVLVGVAMLSVALITTRSGAQQKTTSQAAADVEVVTPSRRKMTRSLKLPGSLTPDEQVDLFAKTSGYVAEVKVDIGDRVSAGDELVTISVPEMADEMVQAEAIVQAKQAKVRAAEARATQAGRRVEIAQSEVRRAVAQMKLDALNLERKQELAKAKAIPEQVLDEARSTAAISEAQFQIAGARVAGAQADQHATGADVDVALADVTVAKADRDRLETLMNYASITAPFDGVITRRNVDRGAFVRSAAEGTTTPLLHIAKTDRIRVVLDIPEVDASYVRIGTGVEIVVKALGEHPFPRKVSRTAGALEPETRTMRVEVDLDNTQPDRRLLPGMYAQVTVNLDVKDQALMIPSKAVRAKGRDTFVLVARNRIVAQIPIQIGYDDGIWAEIITGLKGDESVITAASSVLAPGASVNPVPADTSGI